MAEATLQTRRNQLAVAGDLTFATVPALWREVQVLLQSSKVDEAERVTVDLAQVGHSDSSGVALLVAWLNQAQQFGRTVQFINAPAQMRALVQVASLTELLGWEKA